MLSSTRRFIGVRSTLRSPVLARFNSSAPPKNQHPAYMPEGFDDYPEVKDYFPQKRSPYLKWDDRQNRRNLGEPVHVYHDMVDVWAPDHHDFVSDSKAVRHFLYFMGALAGFAGIIYVTDVWPDRPAMPRSYPHGGLAKDLGARNGDDHLFAARVDKTA
ncbi:unnamed protein product [[Candida] boidinii]|nr:hypothetical protein BVG19_g2710 [[Candida] boidinii]OWB52480.1 hypothetical protein B5S27_g4056 [[Candida] boidinii]OWB66769.1 hypothetical protein B5S30_g2114 [[Candida] boidinii]OWB83419.1 hypothetical protein B5S33_g2049 [[Candida] boidinii]GMF09008.1 unnamed protein product [[Candida] boidinii]